MDTMKSVYCPDEYQAMVYETTEGICLWVTQDGEAYNCTVNRAEFADAVREAGFVVIDNADLPAVVPTGDGFVTVGDIDCIYTDYATSDERRKQARFLLALAKYQDANPPKPAVDPVEVAEWQRVLRDADESLSGTQIDSLARHFAANGFPRVSE